MADKISVENKGVLKLAAELKKSPDRIAKATILAANKVMGRAEGLVAKNIQIETGIKTQKAFKERKRFFFARAKEQQTVVSSGLPSGATRDAFARLWIGLNAIPARQPYWGLARQFESYSSVGDYAFADAWVGYRKSKAGPGIYKRIGPQRFPIKLQGVEIARPGVRAAINRVVDVSEIRFSNEIIRLLNIDWDKVSSKVSA